jgi:hypothetical protein
MPNLLPPHASGALAAITACPAADVIFVGHTGLDRLVSVRDVWRSLHADMRISARWWRVPAASVPRWVSRDAQVSWLYDWWERIDAWITAENQAMESEARADGARESGAVENGARADGARENGAMESGARADGARESGAVENGAVENGARADGARENGARESGPMEIGNMESEAMEDGASEDADMKDTAIKTPATEKKTVAQSPGVTA